MKDVKKINKLSFISRLLVVLSLVIITTFVSTPLSALASTGNRTYTSSGKMELILNTGETGDSSEAVIKVTSLPDNAKITRLTVNVGKLSYNGAIITNYLTIRSSNNRSEEISWNGQGNKTLTTSAFLSSKADGTYYISFNATSVGGFFVGGMQTNYATKTYSKPSITIYWDDTL